MFFSKKFAFDQNKAINDLKYQKFYQKFFTVFSMQC